MKTKFVRLCAQLFIFALLSGCAQPEQAEIPYQPTLSIHDLMVQVMEPAADGIWDSAGFIITVEGEQDLQPTTQEGWDAVRNSASMVAESGNLLMLPGYRADTADWVDYSKGLIRTGLKARAAAEAQDADALFDAGGEIYNVCRACHNRYIVEPE